jgi:hypothetical protein
VRTIQSGWILVLVGTALVAVGGLLATLGWDKIRSERQWRNAVVGVVRESELNDMMIQAALDVARRWPTRRGDENFSYDGYQAAHVTAMVTSGTVEDRRMLGALEAYQRAISRFNAALRIVGRHNPGMFLRVELIHQNDPKAWPQETRDALAEPFRSLLAAHEDARGTLERAYPWAVRIRRQ